MGSESLASSLLTMRGLGGRQVALAVSKGADVTEMLLARRYCDAYIAVEALALGDLSAKDSILNGLASGTISHCEPFTLLNVAYARGTACIMHSRMVNDACRH